MNSSFLYQAWGLYGLECTREQYKGNRADTSHEVSALIYRPYSFYRTATKILLKPWALYFPLLSPYTIFAHKLELDCCF